MDNYSLRFGRQEHLRHETPKISNIKERYKHSYIVGKTGMGKSSLMEHMAQYDANKGFATIFIDPVGDSCKKLCHLIQDKSRIEYISIKSPIVINPLNKEGFKLDNLIQEFIQILDVLVTLTASNPESTVLMREIITMAMRSITKERDKNLDYLTKFLLYPQKRKDLLMQLNPNTDEYVYWKEFDDSSGRSFTNKDKIDCAKRVASRLIEISNGEMRDFVIGKNEFDITRIVQEGKIILVDTSRMNRNSRIYLSNLVVYAVLTYCEFGPKDLKPLFIYVDEFQIVVSKLFADLLARSRKFQVSFTLAHQNFQQIPKNILGEIFGTVGTYVCFRCGDEEAHRFAPIFNIKTQDLFNLPEYQAWVRLGSNNTLIKTYTPKFSQIPDGEAPTSKQKFSESQNIEKEFNFLGETWIDM